MADKDIKPRAATPRATAPKPTSTAKPVVTRTPISRSTTAKPTAAAKPAASVKKQESPASITQRAADANRRQTPAAKPAANAAKPTQTAQNAKPVVTRTPVSKSAPLASKPSQSAKPSAQAAKPTAPAAKRSEAQTSVNSVRAEKESAAAHDKKVKAAAMTDTSKPTAKPTAKAKSGASKSSRASSATATDDSRKRIMIITIVVCVLVLAAVLGIIFGVRSCGGQSPAGGDKPFQITAPSNSNTYNAGGELKPKDPYENVGAGEETVFNPSDVKDYDYNAEKVTNTAVGYYGKVIGETERVIPQKTRDEGLGVYPKYGYTLSTVIGNGDEQVRGRNELIAESSYLTATGTWNAGGGNYKWMDKDGFLYNGTTAEPEKTLDKTGKHRRLYKHSASVGLYMGDVSPDEPGIIKKVTMRPRGYNGYGVTGVYAPAGEVIKIQMSEADMNATGGVVIHIGQALYNGKANNIWTAKGQMQRIPHLLNTMVVDKNTSVFDAEAGIYTAYVGSFIGGPLYIRNEGVTFTATISGGVAYQHFILGYTTEEEFSENAKSSAPYFDLEVWHNGVLHSGPKSGANGLSYDDIYKVAVLWDKVASVTTTGSSQGIVFLYDPFVAAGAAVAFPGQGSVNCPAGWMHNAIDYNSIVSSGSWGNFHEYHHNFQGYGVGNGGEVTNNGMTLVSYALFTNISAKRGLGGYGSQGLGGWNSYTSATWALNEVLKIAKGQDPSNGKQGLTLYSTLLHNLGADNYIQAKVRQRAQSYGENYTGYLRAWQDVTHNDMTYFFKDVLKGIDGDVADKYTNSDYSMFVPVSSVYQTGRSYMYDGEKKYITTMQPYVIPFGKSITVDLDKYDAPDGQYRGGSIVLPDGFSYTVKNVSAPTRGTLELIEGNRYRYTPDGNNRSGKIIVTLGIEKDDGAFEVDDVDLVLEFEPSQEATKMEITRTTYTFGGETKYTDAQTAFESGYAGYTDKQSIVQSNPTQNCNTDIWYYPNTDAEHDKHPDAPDHYFVPTENSVAELTGKLYVQNEGKYRIYIRGRKNCAFYYKTDDMEDYALGGTIKDENAPSNSAYFRPNDPNTYVDVEADAGSWIYFKSVLLAENSGGTISYMGLGMSQWTTPMFTMVEKHYDKNGNEVESAESEGYHHSETHYYNYQGEEVTEEEANNAAPIAPSFGNNNQPFVNAFRTDYEQITSEFETDYFYTRKYTYTHSEVPSGLNQSYIGENPCPDNFPIENLFDGDLSTVCSSKAIVSAAAPWTLFIDLGKTVSANRCVITGYKFNNDGNKNQTPNSFTLYVGQTQDDLREVASFTNGAVNGVTTQFNIEKSTFRYYKLVVTHTVEGRFAAIADIAFTNTLVGVQSAPDGADFTYGGDWTAKSTQSTFGHVYVGKRDATVSFTFKGTQFGILSSSLYGDNFEITIDGQKINSVELSARDGTYLSYLSEEIESGEHHVVVKCLGSASIDSFVIYP